MLDITERRHPQDGHLRVAIHGREYDMRIATVPTNGSTGPITLIGQSGEVTSSSPAKVT